MPHSLAHQVPSGHVACMPHGRKMGFGFEKLGLDRTGDPLGNLVLDRKDIRQLKIAPLRPDIAAVTRVDELRRNAQPKCGLANASVQHVTRAKLASRLQDVRLFALESKGGAGPDDAQAAEPT